MHPDTLSSFQIPEPPRVVRRTADPGELFDTLIDAIEASVSEELVDLLMDQLEEALQRSPVRVGPSS